METPMRSAASHPVPTGEMGPEESQPARRWHRPDTEVYSGGKRAGAQEPGSVPEDVRAAREGQRWAAWGLGTPACAGPTAACRLGMVTAGTRCTGCCEDWMSSVRVELGPGWCGMNWLPIHFSQGAPGRVKEGPERGSNGLGGILLGWGWGGGGAGGSITEPGAGSTFPLPAPWQPETH